MSRLIGGYRAPWNLLFREGMARTMAERAAILDMDNRSVVGGFAAGMAASVLKFPFVHEVTEVIEAIETWFTRMQKAKV